MKEIFTRENARKAYQITGAITLGLWGYVFFTEPSGVQVKR
jgi:hypothetical protein